MRPPAAGEFRRGGVLLLTAFLGMACGLSALPYYSLSSFIAPLNAAFGWTPGEIGIAISVMTFSQFATGPIAGRLCDRYGVRRLLIPSAVLCALAMSALTLVRGSVFTLYAAYLLVALVGAFTTSVAYSRVVVTWFDRRRGLALGMMMAGSAMMAFCVPLLMARVIAEWGWRGGYLALTLLGLLPVPLLLRFLRERKVTLNGGNRLSYGMPTHAAVRTRQFIVMVLAAAFYSPGISATVAHLMPILGDAGVPRERIAAIASLLGVGILAGRFTAGFLLDRFQRPVVGMLLFLVPIAAYLIFYGQAVRFAPLAVFILGMSMGIEGDVFAYMTSRYFGMRSYAELFGWIFGTMCVTGAAGPVLMLFLESRGGYHVALLLFAVMFLVAALLLGLLGRYPHWEIDGGD